MITLQWDEKRLEGIHEDVPGSDKMIPVFSIHNGDYDWKQMFAFFSPVEGAFYWISGQGCACCDNLFDGIESVNFLNSGSANELKRAIREFQKSHPEVLDNSEREKLFSKVKKYAALG